MSKRTKDYWQGSLMDTISHVEKIGLPYIGCRDSNIIIRFLLHIL
ncbi:Photosystem I reaction center subunit IV (fragment) [Bacillus mycoides]|uniref:Photosystem I reaction center subunit IV n=1 Tax=Bacillus mycoides TaxID=1405 RepID=A0A654A5Y9_BACMY